MFIKSKTAQLLIFSLSFWIVGIVLALWFGLGWLILAETIRRMTTLVPQTYFPILQTPTGIKRADDKQYVLEKRSVNVCYIRRGLNVILWLLLTIAVFLYANIHLIDLFN